MLLLPVPFIHLNVATRQFKMACVAHIMFLFGSAGRDCQVWSDWELSEKRSELSREL